MSAGAGDAAAEAEAWEEVNRIERACGLAATPRPAPSSSSPSSTRPPPAAALPSPAAGRYDPQATWDSI